MSAIEKEIKKLNNDSTKELIVCFDYFDTIVSRIVSPEETKRAWSQRIIDCFQIDVSWERLYDQRRSIENRLYNCKDNNYEFKYNDLMSCIYDAISIDCVSKNDFIQKCNDIEVSIELNAQFANKDVFSLIEYCERSHIKMALVSDFYFGESSFLTFLENFGLADIFDKLFISCDYSKSKKKRDLYSCVREYYPNHQYVMIGDNYSADFDNANKEGFKAFLINRKKQYIKYKKFDADTDSYIKRYLKSLYKEDTLLSNYVYALYLFTDRLYNALKKTNTTDIFFLSRDGEFLKQLFDLYQKDIINDYTCNTHYLLVSRNSTYLPARQPIDKETFDLFKDQYSDISLEDYLYSLSFNGEEIERISEELSVANEEHISFNKNNDLLDKLLQNATFRKLYENKRVESNNAFVQYLKNNIVDLNNITIIDVGWKGTIQDNIYRALAGKCSIIGYYYGLTDTLNITESNSKIGLMFSPEDKNNKFYYDHWFIENILTGSHQKVCGYSDVDNRIRIEYENDSDSLLFELCIKNLRIEIIKKFIAIKNLFFSIHISTDNYIREMESLHYLMAVMYPVLNKKQNYLIRMLHSEGFGNISSISDVSTKGFLSYYNKEYGVKYTLSSVIQAIKILFDS